MKVDVLTLADVKIKRWRWYSDWIDIAVFDHKCRPYLIQMRISRTNAKSFRTVCMTGWSSCFAYVNDVGSLTPMKAVAK